MYVNACEGGGGGGWGGVDCDQSLFFFRFNEGSARELDGPRKEKDYA